MYEDLILIVCFWQEKVPVEHVEDRPGDQSERHKASTYAQFIRYGCVNIFVVVELDDKAEDDIQHAEEDEHK